MRNRRGLLALSLLALPTFGGCAFHDLELGAPDLDVVLELDRPTYSIGEPVIAELTIINRGENRVAIPLQSAATTEFFKRSVSVPDSFHVNFVDAPFDAPDFIDIDPGDEFSRQFILPLASRDPGSFRFFAVYRSELEGDLESSTTTSSNPVTVDISPPAVLHRDDNGRISKEDATKLAAVFFNSPGGESRAELILDTTYKVHVWWVTVQLADGSSRSCLVNPYTASVWQETDEHVSG